MLRIPFRCGFRLQTPSVSAKIAVCFAAWSASSTLAQQSAQYRVAPLPQPNGAGVVNGIALNNSNQVTGGLYANQQVHPFICSDGLITMLDEVEGVQTSGFAINDAGHVAGWMYEWGVIWPQAFLWDGETNHWLVDPNDSYSYAQGLNERDQVVGFYFPPGGHANGNAFVVTDGAYYDLGGGQATDISESGIIVGQINRYFGDTAVWTPDGRGGWSLTVLDGLLATAINDAGTMFVGAGPLVSYLDTPVLWTRNGNSWERSDIGNWDPTLESALPNDVNNRGLIVGDHQSFEDGNHGWLFRDGAVSWLDDLLEPGSAGWHIERALRINESGVILADAIPDGGRVAQSVLLLPNDLTILAPRSGAAGATNELIAISATPGSRVYFVYSFGAGNAPLPGCPGVRIGLASPRFVGSSVANADREARLEVFVPRAAAGRTTHLQAVDPSQCTVSNVLIHRFR